jgi:serine/threonine-protein kinase
MGVMAYEMLVGRIPFPGPNFLAQKQQGVYAPAGASVPGLPPALDALFAAALAPDPAKRFRSAGAFAGALDALAA